MGCGCNKTVKRTNNTTSQPVRTRTVRNLPTRDNNNGKRIIRRILERY